MRRPILVPIKVIFLLATCGIFTACEQERSPLYRLTTGKWASNYDSCKRDFVTFTDKQIVFRNNGLEIPLGAIENIESLSPDERTLRLWITSIDGRPFVEGDARFPSGVKHIALQLVVDATHVHALALSDGQDEKLRGKDVRGSAVGKMFDLTLCP